MTTIGKEKRKKILETLDRLDLFKMIDYYLEELTAALQAGFFGKPDKINIPASTADLKNLEKTSENDSEQ